MVAGVSGKTSSREQRHCIKRRKSMISWEVSKATGWAGILNLCCLGEHQYDHLHRSCGTNKNIGVFFLKLNIGHPVRLLKCKYI